MRAFLLGDLKIINLRIQRIHGQTVCESGFLCVFCLNSVTLPIHAKNTYYERQCEIHTLTNKLFNKLVIFHTKNNRDYPIPLHTKSTPVLLHTL